MAETVTLVNPAPAPDNSDADEALQQMIAMAQSRPEPGDFAAGQVINTPTQDVPVPIVASQRTSAGYVVVYDTRTGEQSLCNRNMLPAQLKKTHGKLAGKEWFGKRAFTTIKPPFEPKRGTLKCLLHPGNPDRDEYDSMGLEVCYKDNIPNKFQLNNHMLRKHKTQWAAIQEARQRKEHEEDRALQRAILHQAAVGVGITLTAGSGYTPLNIISVDDASLTTSPPVIKAKTRGWPKGKPRVKKGKGTRDANQKGEKRRVQRDAVQARSEAGESSEFAGSGSDGS